MNLNNNHWILVCINRVSYEITILNSFNPHSNANNYHDNALEGVFLTFLNCKISGTQFDVKKYKFIYENSTSQIDASTCGYLTVLNLFRKMNLIHFEIGNSPTFFRLLKAVMLHEIITNDFTEASNTSSSFLMNIL